MDKGELNDYRNSVHNKKIGSGMHFRNKTLILGHEFRTSGLRSGDEVMNRSVLTKKRSIIVILICVVLAVSSVAFWQTNNRAQAAIIDPHPGLVGWWRFDEGTGTIAGDSSGNGNNGTINSSSFVSGRYGTALSFTGSVNSYLQVPDSSSLEVTGDLTLSAWLYPTAANRMIIISKYWNNEFDLLISPNGRLEIAFGNPFRDLFSAGAVSLNTWTQVCVVRKVATNQVDFYINGNLDSTQTYSATTISTSTKPVQLGKDTSNTDFYSGLIDEAQIYNRALSSTEIQANFQQNPDFSSNVLVKVPMGTTQVITTLSWQGTGSISVTILSPSQTFTEATVPVYQKSTYSSSGNTSGMLNIKRISVSVNALPSDQNWNVALTFDKPVAYQITIEVQK
jgi:hypothetical protein